MPHNMDFHAATGALGGAALTLINPGEQVVLRWKAIRTGVFVYHCAPGGPMIPWHVVSGSDGSVGAVMYKFLQPGIYAYVTHNLIEAADLGFRLVREEGSVLDKIAGRFGKLFDAGMTVTR
jgi:hypothetical protein